MSKPSWDELFKPQTQATGVGATVAPKPAAAAPIPFPVPAQAAAAPAPASVADVAEDLFSLLGDEPDNSDDSSSPTDIAAAKSTLAAIFTEPAKATAAPVATPVPAQPVAVAATEPKKRGRGPAKKTPVTAEVFKNAMETVAGGTQAAETLFPETVAANDVSGASESAETVARENQAIEAAVRFLATVIIRKLQS